MRYRGARTPRGVGGVEGAWVAATTHARRVHHDHVIGPCAGLRHQGHEQPDDRRDTTTTDERRSTGASLRARRSTTAVSCLNARACGTRPSSPTGACPAHQARPSFDDAYCGPNPSAGNGSGPSANAPAENRRALWTRMIAASTITPTRSPVDATTTHPRRPSLALGAAASYPVPDTYVCVSIGPSDRAREVLSTPTDPLASISTADGPRRFAATSRRRSLPDRITEYITADRHPTAAAKWLRPPE